MSRKLTLPPYSIEDVHTHNIKNGTFIKTC